MEIESILEGITKTPKDLKAPKAPRDKDSVFELKKLQQQMQQYAIKEKKPYSTFFNFSENTTYDSTTMDDLVNKEIASMKKRKKGWKTLPKCVQLDLVNEYLATQETPTQEAEQIRKALISGKIDLVITYDSKLQCVTNIVGSSA
jgi:hypothetical protein